MNPMAESVVEEAALVWLGTLGWSVAHGPDLAPGMPGAERDSCCAAVLEREREVQPPEFAVTGRHGRRADPYQHLVVGGRRLLHPTGLEHVGWAESVHDDRGHPCRVGVSHVGGQQLSSSHCSGFSIFCS